MVIYATRFGPWAYSDSVSYIEAGRNFADGRGLAEISASGSVNFFLKQPPLLPVILALLHTLGADLILAMRWMDVGLIATLLFTMSWLSYQQKRWTYLGIPLLWLTAPIVLENYSSFMSEPLYLTTGATGLILLVVFLERHKHWTFFAASVLIALAAMTRYAGSVFIAAGALTLLLFDSGSFRKRLGRLLIYLIISTGPLGLWVATQFPGSGRYAGSLIPPSAWWSWLAPFRINFSTILAEWIPALGWVVSHSSSPAQWRISLLTFALLSSLVLVLIIAGIRLIKKNPQTPSTREMDVHLAVAFTAAGAIHLVFLLVVTLLGPWEVRIDARQLSPLFVFGFSGAFFALGCAARTPFTHKIALALQALLLTAFILHGIPGTAALGRELHAVGRGYTGVAWQDSLILETLESAPQNITIFSNDIEGIMFHTGLAAYRLPEMQSGTPVPLDEQFGSRSNDPLHELFRSGEAMLVLFEDSNWRFEEMYHEDTNARLEGLIQDLEKIFSTPEGAIFTYSNSAP